MKSFTGVIISLKSPQTAVVVVEYMRTHALYKKQVRRARKMKAHYEEGQYRVGEMVTIVETRPLSKGKHFRIVNQKK